MKILLTNQAHFDHVAAMAEIKKLSGAKLMSTEGDKAVLEDGGRATSSGERFLFAPVKVDGVLKDGEIIAVGRCAFEYPPDAGAYQRKRHLLDARRENGRDYNVVFANMPSVIGAPLIDNTKYPSIAKDFERSFRVQKALACDVFLAAHGSQYRLRRSTSPHTIRMLSSIRKDTKAPSRKPKRIQSATQKEQRKIR